MANGILTPIYSLASRNGFPSLDFSSLRPSRAWTDSARAAAAYTGVHLASLATTNSRMKVLERVVDALHQSGLPGPARLMDLQEYLGQGSQFYVYKDHLLVEEGYEAFTTMEVAVKQPKFDLDLEEELDLADSGVREHVYHMYLEIFTLTNPALRVHPNIARLIAWSDVGLNPRLMPTLVMELAESDLATLLADDVPQLSPSQKYSLCQDVGAGLDALHDCHILHGDLKPKNILIFRHEGCIVAKLADFGLSLDQAESDLAIAYLGGTPGWQAPEVEVGSKLSSHGLLQADNYSFGLLVWSIILHSGKVPSLSTREARQAIATRELKDARDIVGLEMCRTLTDAVQKLLEYDFRRRPLRVADVLDDRPNDEEYGHGVTLDFEYKFSTYGRMPSRHAKSKRISWELNPVPDMFIDGLHLQFLNDLSNLPGDILFALFLAFTASQPSDQNTEDRALNILVAAARSGYEPAQGIIPAAHKFFQLEPQQHIKELITEWLKSAVGSGSTLAIPELEKLDPPTLYDAISDFRINGGYNRFYCAIDPSFNNSVAPQNKPTQRSSFRYSRLHWLATYGNLSALLDYFNTNRGYGIDDMTDNQETPLYLACARGSWEIAAELMRRGACASVRCTSFEISCMHWVFAFGEMFQAEAVIQLKGRGADLNARTSTEVPFFHYPFVLPAGTPLHWAVATSSHKTIQVLVTQGADLLIRDGSDPYVYDGRVRILNDPKELIKEEGPPLKTETKGLSPLDLAAMQHDPFIFELLISTRADVDINAVDEEGFSVLHRLSASYIWRTSAGIAFSTLPFRGNRIHMRDGLIRSVAAIKALGADMELLTTPLDSKAQQRKRVCNFPSRTPLMLACMNSATDAVRTLLEAGASVRTENDVGQTALHCISRERAACVECVCLLVFYGADINHCDKYGGTVLLRAAFAKCLEVVEFCLAKGADIEVQEQHPLAIEKGEGPFHLLSPVRSDMIFQDRWDRDFLLQDRWDEGIELVDKKDRNIVLRDKWDLKLARLLERYVLACPHVEKKRRVIEFGSPSGETILHVYALYAMQHCVAALILHGAPVNAIERNPAQTQGDFVYGTPLDAAIRGKKRRAKGRESKTFTNSEYEDSCRKADAVIDMLQRAGGVSISDAEITKKWFVPGETDTEEVEFQKRSDNFNDPDRVDSEIELA
ncbi:hypothetical protein EPUS_08790 [Endocarpon pusillum Z07020]|uniref:Protein kinase domain-containing protein n=1 Tax=Endocarpon pusillum (strain Z07020 / HMAS-L-300199) TaxID=1263415 RepID=U1HV73_ENDPU|nr:uncharacterized protein EPUS_08790 [Endocarpon pusillum Z07020]ERF73239.1 hypothetical protein EPUS_08790 [Endocarpon pusillum Z07020]